jgi:hypothetical protein
MFEDGNISPCTWLLTVLIVLAGLTCYDALGSEVVINEIHSDPDVKTDLVEYVELHNTSGQVVDLSGWYFSDGIFYIFDEGTTLPAGGYVIVCQSPADVHAKWDTGRFQLPGNAVLGPYDGKLNNEGEQIVLCNADGEVMDQVDYQLGFPWPTVGDSMSESMPGTGNSMQLVNPMFDNDLAGSWRWSPGTAVSSPTISRLTSGR